MSTNAVTVTVYEREGWSSPAGNRPSMRWPSPTPDAYPNHSNDKGRNYLHRQLDKPDLDGFRCGAFETGGPMTVGQPEHTLSGAQPKQRIVGQQIGDHRDHRWADQLGAVAAPGRAAHRECNLLRG